MTTPKRKPGRPRKGPRSVLYARVSDEERRQCDAAAQAAGFRSTGDWLRAVALRAAGALAAP